MSELTLIKMPFEIASDPLKGRPVVAEQIIGITPANEATIPEHGHIFDGNEQEELLELPDPAIDNLVEFYRQTRARPVDGRPDYSCHTFVYFVLGKTTYYWTL